MKYSKIKQGVLQLYDTEIKVRHGLKEDERMSADMIAVNTDMEMDFVDSEKYKKLFEENKELFNRLALGFGNLKENKGVEKKRSKLCIYYTKDDVAEFLGISDPQAYKIIRSLNAELEKKGYVTVAGRISKVYFHDKYYGLEKMVSESAKGE
jgi:hypothetical protein